MALCLSMEAFSLQKLTRKKCNAINTTSSTFAVKYQSYNSTIVLSNVKDPSS